MENATFLIDKLMEYYSVSTITELAEIIKIGQPAISKWKKDNKITAIKKKCRELNIYNEIFIHNNAPKISIDLEESDVSKYFTALQSVAIASKKEDELIVDIKELINKYIQI